MRNLQATDRLLQETKMKKGKKEKENRPPAVEGKKRMAMEKRMLNTNGKICTSW